MMTEISSNSAESTAGAGLDTATENLDTATAPVTDAASTNPTTDTASAAQSSIPVVGADGKTTYVPNYKYKAALQEKELDPFFHPLVKDPDSEKRVKELFTKVDAFDFVKSKKEQIEQQYNSIQNDYEAVSNVVKNFDNSVKSGDLSSAFRLAGITKEQVFKWAQQQIQIMEMPADQRAQYEQFEQAKAQKTELEQRVNMIQQQYETQATQARVMQLDMALNRPDVAKFAEAWDRQGEPGSFKNFVIEEAKKTFYESRVDLSPEQAIANVMQRFGKFLNMGETMTQSPQATPRAQGQKPVIPNVVGKASSPIKKVPRSLDDLRKLAKEARD